MEFFGGMISSLLGQLQWQIIFVLAFYLQMSCGQIQPLRQKRQQPVNMPTITGLDVTCEKTGMTVNLQFSAPFNGVVFSKGHFSNPACRYVKRNSRRSKLQLTVPLSSCGTQTVESSSDRLMIENTIIIQADAMVQDSWDSARKITCDWQSKLEKMVTFAPFGVADLLQVAEVKFAGSGDNVRTRMEIQFGRGPFAAPLEGLTKIGDELTVVVYAEDGGAGYDVLVKNCYAYDSRDFKRANKIRLLNDHGCLFRPHQMEYFKRTFDTRSTGADIIAFARMNAFKFPDKMDVFLSCELEMCKGGCDTHCEMDDYPIDIIDTLTNVRQSSNARQDTESVPITTFRPESRKIVKGVKRRRKPKKFGPDRRDDDAASLLTPPVTLSPEILELLEELSAQDGPTSAAQNTEKPFKGNTNSLEQIPVQPQTQTHQVVASLVSHAPDTPDNNGFSFDDAPGTMSFSTLFAGTHTTQDNIPVSIINNHDKFKPSQLLSASIGRNSGPFTDQITSLSKGSTGRTPAQFPPRLPPQSAALQAPHSSKLTNILEQEQTASNPFFKAGKTDKNVVVPTGQLSVKFPASLASQPVVGPQSINYNNQQLNNRDNSVNTLQQQLRTEGQFVCSSGTFDPKCNPQSNQINVGGFLPISTTPNVLSSTVIFTSPRSVEKFQQQLSSNPNQPKEVLIKIIDSPKQSLPKKPPGRSQSIKSGRKRFGSRLQANAKRFAHFFGARKRRDADDWEMQSNDNIRNVFAESETVNVIKGFQVVSAADLAFDPTSIGQLYDNSKSILDLEDEICFPETSFYAGLLVACSVLMISGLVSVCSIRQVRKYQRASAKKMFFGGGDASLDSYN